MVKTQILVLATAIILFIVIIDLVRLRRLREEYSWLWLIAACFYLVMAIKPDWVKWISDFLGITNAVTAFIFIGLLFVIFILIHYSVVLSKLVTQMKDLAQLNALMGGEIKKINGGQRDQKFLDQIDRRNSQEGDTFTYSTNMKEFPDHDS